MTKARQEAARRGLDAEFTEADAAGWRGTADRALCIGASHAFGGTAGGRLLYGDGFWAATPTEAAVEMIGEQTTSLADLLEACRASQRE